MVLAMLRRSVLIFSRGEKLASSSQGVNVKATRTTLAYVCLLSALDVFAFTSFSYAQARIQVAPTFTRTAVMILMRDGVKLNTEIFVPKRVDGSLPFMLLRTPYGIAGGGARIHGDYLKDLAADGYIFV